MTTTGDSVNYHMCFVTDTLSTPLTPVLEAEPRIRQRERLSVAPSIRI